MCRSCRGPRRSDGGCGRRETSPTWVLGVVRRWGRTGSAAIPPRSGRFLRLVVEGVLGFMEGGAQNTSCQVATHVTSGTSAGRKADQPARPDPEVTEVIPWGP